MSYTTIFHSIKSEIKENLSLSVPLISAQLVYACSGFIATAFVARLGEDALAASILVSMIWVSLHMLFFGLLNAISVLVSHQIGAKNYLGISRIMGQSFLLGFVMMVLLVLTLLLLPLCFRWSAQPASVLKLANAYTHSLIWTVPGLVMLVICEQFLAGINRAKLVLRISLLVVPIEIPLIYVLMFGKLGLPAAGIAGIGYGFAVTYTMTTIVLVWYLLKSKSLQAFGLFKCIREWHPDYMKELIRVGLPMGFMHVIEISAFAVATFWIAQFGTTLLAAHQIVIQYLSFVITAVFAMSQAVTIRVGYGVGAQDIDMVRTASYVGMILSFFFIVCIMLAFILKPDFFISFDLDIHKLANQELVHDASALLSICGVLLIFDNFRLIGFGALRGLKDTRFPMCASIVSFWVIGLVLAYTFGFTLNFGGQGIWWGLVAGIASGAVIVLLRIKYFLKRPDLNKIMSIKA